MIEKILIADKKTLGNPNPTVADTSNVMNFLKKIDDTVLNQSGVNQTFIGKGSLNIDTPMNLVDVTGKGKLKGVTFSASNSNLFLQILVDGVSIFAPQTQVRIVDLTVYANTPIYMPLDFEFNNSLLIKVTSNATSSYTASAIGSYELF